MCVCQPIIFLSNFFLLFPGVIVTAILSAQTVEEGGGGEVCVSITPELLERAVFVAVQTMDANATGMATQKLVLTIYARYHQK